MICPACGHIIKSESLTILSAQTLGSLGGRTKGKTKARAVDYSALARLSHQKRAENKANK